MVHAPAPETFERLMLRTLNRCPDCDGTGYVGVDYDEVEPCGCIAPDVRGAMQTLAIDLECEGIDNPLAETFTLAAVLADLSRLLGIEPPARVAALVG